MTIDMPQLKELESVDRLEVLSEALARMQASDFNLLCFEVVRRFGLPWRTKRDVLSMLPSVFPVFEWSRRTPDARGPDWGLRWKGGHTVTRAELANYLGIPTDDLEVVLSPCRQVQRGLSFDLLPGSTPQDVATVLREYRRKHPLS